MDINYWNCPHMDYDLEVDSEGDENHYYGCLHPLGGGMCKLQNKWNDEEAECLLLDAHKDEEENIN